jgi:hypothetical protein
MVGTLQTQTAENSHSLSIMNTRPIEALVNGDKPAEVRLGRSHAKYGIRKRRSAIPGQPSPNILEKYMLMPDLASRAGFGRGVGEGRGDKIRHDLN